MDNALDTAYGRMLTVEAFLDGGLSLDAVCDRLRDVWDVPEPVKYLAQRMAARPHTGFRSSLTLTRFGATEGTTPYEALYGRTVTEWDFDGDVTTLDEESLPSVEDVADGYALTLARSEYRRLAERVNSLRRKAKERGWSDAWVQRITDPMFDRAYEIEAEFGRMEILEEQPLISEYDSAIKNDLVAWLHRHDPEVEVDAETAKCLGLEDATEFSSIRAMRRADWVERRTAERRVELHTLLTLHFDGQYDGDSEIVTEWARAKSGKWYPKSKMTVKRFVADRIARKDGDALAGYASCCASIRARILRSPAHAALKDVEEFINYRVGMALLALVEKGHDPTSASGLGSDRKEPATPKGERYDDEQ